VIVNVSGVPIHVPIAGVTVMVPVCAEVLGFEAVNPAMFPLPDAPRPIEVVVFVQLYVTFADELLNAIGAIGVLSH
jgi:hypothetical protein